MSEEYPTAEAILGTLGIRVMGTGSESDNFGFRVDPASISPGTCIRRVRLRAEIHTSPPFGSVQEAVTRFCGRGSWVPFKLGEHYRMEEQAAGLEKDLIVKELETLDVLEALGSGSPKRVVDDSKWQLQQEALRCKATPEHVRSVDIKEMNSEHCDDLSHNPQLEVANVKQLAADAAFRRWNKESWKNPKGFGVKNSRKAENFHPSNQNRRSFFGHLSKPETFEDLPKPVLKPNISMRDLLSRKQVTDEDLDPEEARITRRIVNLSQVMDELKEDMKHSTRAEKEMEEAKQILAQRRKFGLIRKSRSKARRKVSP